VNVRNVIEYWLGPCSSLQYCTIYYWAVIKVHRRMHIR